MNAFVQDCPPSYYACEICDDLDCTSEKWIKCPNRLKAAEYMKAFEELPLNEFACEYQENKRTSSEKPKLDLEPEEI